MRIIRSLLFATANRHELLRKFPGYPADAFAIDLEDGTLENDKAAARDQLPAIVTYLAGQPLRARIMGGNGFSKDFPVERFYRDAPLLVIGGGTNELQRIIIARQPLQKYAI